MIDCEHWDERPITDLADFIDGYAFAPDDWSREGLPIIRIEQLRNFDSVSDWYSGTLPIENIIENGDLIFSWSASLFLKIWSHGKAALNQHLFKVVEHDGVDRLYLKYLIEYNLPRLKNASHGSTMQHVTRRELRQFLVRYPIKESEQALIAALLQTVDKAIEQTEAMIAKQERIKTGLMQDLLTKGIDKHGNIRSEATHKFKDSPLGRIPEEWECDALGAYLNSGGGFIQTGPFGSQLHSYEYVDEGIPVVMPQDMLDDEISLKSIALITPKRAKDLSRHKVEVNDVLFARRGELDRCAAIYEREQGWICGTGCLLMRMARSNLNPTWVTMTYKHHRIQRQVLAHAVGSTMINLNQGLLKDLSFPRPSLAEQHEICLRLSTFDASLSGQHVLLGKLQLLKLGLMQDLLSGKVPVTHLLKQSGSADVENVACPA